MSTITLQSPRRGGAVTLRDWAHATVLVPALAASAVVLARTSPVGAAPAWADHDQLWRPAELDLSVVLPTYNTGRALTRTVLGLVAELDAAGCDFEVVVSCDGSTDGSCDQVESLDPRVRVVWAPRNQGKGAALHRGFAAARGRHVALLDADGDIAPHHVVDQWRTAVHGGHDVVYADKCHERSQVTASRWRRLISRVFVMVVGLLFTLPVRDTQTGCKTFRRDVLARVLPLLHERGFSLDLEVFLVAHTLGFDDLCSAPVVIGERLAGSTVGTAAILRTIGEMLRILGRHRLGHAYEDAPVVPLSLYLERREALVPAQSQGHEVLAGSIATAA